ncbi:DUF1801 domain-containing protein [Candidatus Saccharibacteria bacterium]|nr:DUF1801 domain-containing protein [Candidatus Saccharibacteria bacterium]
MNEIDRYLGQLKSDQRRELTRIRSIVNNFLPDAEEVISYAMPGFKYKDKYLAGYAASSDHMSFYPTAKPIEKLKSKLADYKTSKGTIQFTGVNPLTEELIIALVKTRLEDIK